MEFPVGALYMVVPKCAKAGSLVLGQKAVPAKGDPTGHVCGPVQLIKADDNDPQCLWEIRDNEHDGKLELRNEIFVYGRAGLTAPRRNSPVQMVHSLDLRDPDDPRAKTPPAHHWVMKPQTNTEWFALQLADNPSQNLNVAGNGPYTEGNPVYAYDWGGGNPNELWLFQRVS